MNKSEIWKAIVISFARISYILTANEHFGPLQISLGKEYGSSGAQELTFRAHFKSSKTLLILWTVKKTVDDFYKWIVLFLMIFASFLFGLHSLYSYFGKELTYRDNFTGIEATFITLFWSLFGLSDYRGVELEQFPLSEWVWIINSSPWKWAAFKITRPSTFENDQFRDLPFWGPSNFWTLHVSFV